MENNVPYKVFETAQARSDRRFKQMWALVLILLVLLVGSNFAWLIYENQFEEISTSTQTVTQDGGDNSFTGDFIGGDYYGETDSN